MELPLHALRAQAASAIHLVVQMSRQVGGRRLVTQISEVAGRVTDDGRYVLNDLFTLKRDPATQQMQLAWTGAVSAMAGKLTDAAEAALSDLTRPILSPDHQDRPG